MPRKARSACALVSADGVLAGGAIVAGVLHALIDIDLTGLAWEQGEEKLTL